LKSLYNAATADHKRLHVIITLRADFYDRPLLYPEFGDMLRQRTEVVLPLNTDELTRAIISPAERAGITVEPALSNALVRDVSEQPGALPLLQYTLTDLFERHAGQTLTYSAYQEAGGISGTLARRADEFFTQLTPYHQRLARQIFLRLVAVSEGGETTRQRVRWASLLSAASEEDKPHIREILDLFGRNRLLTFDHDPQTREPTVEVAHEALIRAWDRLQEWLEESRADLLTQRRLAAAINEWNNANRDSSYLATGSRLGQFEAWRSSTMLALTEDEITYIDASIALRRRAALRLRLFIAALIVFTLVSLGLAKFAFDQQAATARQAMISRSRELAATALTNLPELDLSVLLSMEAIRSTQTFEASNSLLTGLQRQPNLIAFMHGHADWVRGVAFSPNGALIASAGRDGTVHRWHAASHAPAGEPLTGHDGQVNSVTFSPDGALIASAGRDAQIRLWDAASGEPARSPLEGHTAEIWSVAFNPNGTQLASAGSDGVIMWDLSAEPVTSQRLEGHTDIVYSAVYSPDGSLLATTSADETIRLWDATSGEPVGEPLAAHVNWVLTSAFSPNGRLLASAGVDASIILWDVTTGEALGQIRGAHSNWIRSIAFNPASDVLATASIDGTIRLWDVRTGQTSGSFAGHQDGVWGIAFSPDGELLVSGGQDNNVILWSVPARSRLAHPLDLVMPEGSAVAFSPDGQLVATASGQVLVPQEENIIRLWALPQPGDSGAQTEPALLEGHEEVVTAVAFRPDGQQLASASIDQTVRLWALDGDLSSTPLVGHNSGILSVAYSPDGRRLASGDDTGLVILWDVASGQTQGDPLTDHTDSINALVFSPDGSRIA
ncbi:MAG: hypothetical protein JXN59_13230, partial [Anaerolineae bacterium]|nr:hypothetical protein [Anaerolineae bacterium]